MSMLCVKMDAGTMELYSGQGGCWKTALRRDFTATTADRRILRGLFSHQQHPLPHFQQLIRDNPAKAKQETFTMSAPPYRQPGQYDETGDVERRLQEEYRRQGQGPPRVGFPSGRPRQGDPGAYPMPMVGSEAGMPPGSSPYYQRSQHPSPYGRPYIAGQAAGYGGVPSPNDLAAGIYARRAAPGYGYGVPPHGPSSGTSPDQRYPHPPPYGMPPGSDSYAAYYGRQPGGHDMYGQRPPDGSMGHPAGHHPYGPQSPPNAPSPKGASPSSRATPPGIPGSGGSKGQSGDADDDEEGRDGQNGDESGAGSGSDNDDDEEENEENGESQKWFHGSVPLGLEDDKYWLSELQVYLRANFAEAFGATEEDIAGEYVDYVLSSLLCPRSPIYSFFFSN